MTPNEYQKLVLRTECKYSSEVDILKERLIHSALGLHKEAGEFSDTVCAWLFYGKNLISLELKDELGDVAYFLALACEASGTTLERIMESNIAKLKARYPEGFSEEKYARENRDLETEKSAQS